MAPLFRVKNPIQENATGKTQTAWEGLLGGAENGPGWESFMAVQSLDNTVIRGRKKSQEYPSKFYYNLMLCAFYPIDSANGRCPGRAERTPSHPRPGERLPDGRARFGRSDTNGSRVAKNAWTRRSMNGRGCLGNRLAPGISRWTSRGDRTWFRVKPGPGLHAPVKRQRPDGSGESPRGGLRPGLKRSGR